MDKKGLLPGYRSGRITVISEAPRRSGRRYWNCRCDCGSECVVLDSHLKSGHTKSCGCLKRKHPDYTAGMKIWKLTLLKEVERKGKARYWLCRCDCGTECVVQESHIKAGHTKSCGCRQAQIRAENRLESINIAGLRFGRLIALEPTDKRNKTSVVWKCLCDCGKIAFCDTESLNSGNTRSCGCLLDDQRKINMQKAIHFVDGTCIEKIAKPKETAANTSGHRGVWQRENKKWRAELKFRGKRYDLGTYDTFEEAVEARLKGEQRYFEEYLEGYYARQKDALG